MNSKHESLIPEHWLRDILAAFKKIEISMTKYTTEQKQQVTEWLTNLSTRHLTALASQHKIVEYANKTPKHLVDALAEKSEVQLQALEMVNKGIKTHGEEN